MQVVIADPKDRDKDIVVFLAAEHQCSSQEETGQRTAVTALHRVAGERALHRVLPEMYRPMWKQLGEKVSSLQIVRLLLLFPYGMVGSALICSEILETKQEVL